MNKEKKMANEPHSQYIEPTGVLLRMYLFRESNYFHQPSMRLLVNVD